MRDPSLHVVVTSFDKSFPKTPTGEGRSRLSGVGGEDHEAFERRRVRVQVRVPLPSATLTFEVGVSGGGRGAESVSPAPPPTLAVGRLEEQRTRVTGRFCPVTGEGCRRRSALLLVYILTHLRLGGRRTREGEGTDCYEDQRSWVPLHIPALNDGRSLPPLTPGGTVSTPTLHLWIGLDTVNLGTDKTLVDRLWEETGRGSGGPISTVEGGPSRVGRKGYRRAVLDTRYGVTVSRPG